MRIWLGWLDSNQRMQGSKPCALPLGDTPTNFYSAIALLRTACVLSNYAGIFYTVFALIATAETHLTFNLIDAPSNEAGAVVRQISKGRLR